MTPEETTDQRDITEEGNLAVAALGAVTHQTAEDNGLLIINDNDTLNRPIGGRRGATLAVDDIFELLLNFETNLITLIDLWGNAQLKRNIDTFNRVEEPSA